MKLRSLAIIATLALLPTLAQAQTTLGGNAKDNSASGGKENGTAAGAGKGTMMKGTTSGASSSGTGENKTTATGGQPGGKADKN